MGVSCGSSLRDTCSRVADRCSRLFPCFSDPGSRRSAFSLKLALVLLHILFVGVLFLFDRDLIEKTKHEPWYTATYVLLFVATLVQYFATAGTSPGYVIDVQKTIDERDAAARRTLLASDIQKAVDERDAAARKPLLPSNKDNQLQAKMAMLLSLWMEGTITEVMQQLQAKMAMLLSLWMEGTITEEMQQLGLN
ncbi:hypothetical protein SASPL_146870 [Salvia splendens]|uniref:Uncharacterized protein n=1 Tax=Salvia splendens TaxID=180675 RepID=A0A8X8WDG4_SALSN|nr:hypothetical protein SASPL_146870 [Salvia splendens]